MAAPTWLGGAIQGASSIGAGLLGMFGQRRRERRAVQNQMALMNHQFGHQQSLNQQGHDLSYSLWQKTNYPAQVAMLKEAGLNPALLYNSGGGSASTSGQSGGSAAGGQAPAPMDIGAAVQASKLAAELSLIKAQAKKTEAEAEKISDVDTREAETRITSLTQGINNQKAQEELTKEESKLKRVENIVRSGTKDYEIAYAAESVKHIQNQIEEIGLRNNLESSVIDERKKFVKYQATNEMLQGMLIKANTGKSNAEIKQISENIAQKWMEISQNWVNLNQGQQKIEIQKFQEEIKAEYPSLWNVGGSIAKKFYDTLEMWEQKLGGGKPPADKVGQ